MAALIQRGRWPVQRDANGFPIEDLGKQQCCNSHSFRANDSVARKVSFLP
jgi:hypothetical protein